VVTLLFPGSANAYESYGEALETQGDKTEATLLYQKALMIDPKNPDAQGRLKKLEAGN
jgi:tetratricopeptide (TPR) repeat protein